MTSQTSILNRTAIPLGTFAAGSEQWHAARANGLGGSEISAVLGVNPWESHWTLWWRKKDLLPPVRENEYMRMGSLFEPVIYQHYAENLLPAGHTMTTGTTYRHIDWPWMVANPDGLIFDYRGNLVDGLEIKCAVRDDKWGPEGTDQIPIYYKTQVAWYCMVMGLRGLWIRVVFGVGDWRTYRFEPSEEDFETLLGAGRAFMESLAAEEEPDLDDHSATYSALRYLHPMIDSSVVQIPAELADEWWEVTGRFRDAEEELTGLRSRMTKAMGYAWRADCGAQKVAYRQRPAKGGDPFVKSAKRPDFSDISSIKKGS
ncbi:MULTISPECIES: YqaJ viral recombinase family nuclease [Nocardia]|uniref:YqaJ viral recombinase family nuclease n=1 Tax=Nocardia TaxID=1817 RepID=UPI001300738B|nr:MULTISPECIES: YqaJ viral recombinase family protein [Nocardia]